MPFALPAFPNAGMKKPALDVSVKDGLYSSRCHLDSKPGKENPLPVSRLAKHYHASGR